MEGAPPALAVLQIDLQLRHAEQELYPVERPGVALNDGEVQDREPHVVAAVDLADDGLAVNIPAAPAAPGLSRRLAQPTRATASAVSSASTTTTCSMQAAVDEAARFGNGPRGIEGMQVDVHELAEGCARRLVARSCAPGARGGEAERTRRDETRASARPGPARGGNRGLALDWLRRQALYGALCECGAGRASMSAMSRENVRRVREKRDDAFEWRERGSDTLKCCLSSWRAARDAPSRSAGVDNRSNEAMQTLMSAIAPLESRAERCTDCRTCALTSVTRAGLQGSERVAEARWQSDKHGEPKATRLDLASRPLVELVTPREASFDHHGGSGNECIVVTRSVHLRLLSHPFLPPVSCKKCARHRPGERALKTV